jgi:crotonobetainyl-CoA:carnitine CoA-transferase CaiB-like acyl-CoA transferase
MSTALTDIRVVDVSGTIATGYCAKLFADYGADVVNLEPPEGFPTRRIPPYLPDVDAPENAAMHAYLHTGRSMRCCATRTWCWTTVRVRSTWPR